MQLRFIALLTIYTTLPSFLPEVQGQVNPRHEFNTIEQNGVILAVSSGGPKHTIPPFTLEEVLTLNFDPSNEDSYLFRPSGFMMGPDGYFYVADSGNCRVAVFNSTGDYVRHFGRKGYGPGEFQQVDIQYIWENVISLFDRQSSRVTHFALSGDLKDVATAPDRGRFLNAFYKSPIEGRNITVIMDDERDGEYLRSWMEVSISDSTRRHITRFRSPGANASIIRDEGRSMHSMWYAPMPQAQFTPGQGCMVCNGEEPVIELYNLNGDLLKRVSFETPIQPVTREDRANIDEFVHGRLSEAPPGRQRRSRELFFPQNKAFWHLSYLDDLGYIWLIRLWEFDARDSGLGVPCLVISPEGQFLGQCYLPGSTGIFRGGHFFTLITDPETGERNPTVFRIRSAVEGLHYPN